MNRVLLVTFHYPPDGGSSGVLRPLKFSKYLIPYGWTPHVLTVRPSMHLQRDEDLLRDVPAEVVVHRTLAFDSTRHLALGGRYFAFTAVPDAFVTWLPFGIAEGVRVVRRFGVRAIYSTSPPPTAHLVAGAISAVTRLPWIADFRDPWIEEGLHPRPGTLRWRIEAAMERAVVHRASRVVATTSWLRRDLLQRYPEAAPERFRVILNGFDESDFAAPAPPPRRDQFVLIHAGLITPEFRDPLPLLRSVAELIGEGALPRDRVRVILLGGGGYLQSPGFVDAVRPLGLEGVLDVVGRVPYHEAIRALREASVLLLLQDSEDTRSLIPAKAFEYLRIERPILALTPDSASAEILREWEGCHVVNPRDFASLKERVRLLYNDWQQDPGQSARVRAVGRYERRSLAGELAGLLDEACGCASASRDTGRPTP